MKLNKFYLAAFFAFFIWGFFSLALKPIHNYASLDILFYRVFFSVVLMLSVNIFFRKATLRKDWKIYKNMDLAEKKQTVFLTFGGAFFLMLNWFIFIYVMNHVSLKAASLAYLICPILTTVLAFFILKEKLCKSQWIAVLISVFACSLLSFNHIRDIFYSLIVAITYALFLISQRNNNKLDKFLTLNIQLLFTAVLLLPFYPKYSGAFPIEPLFYICLGFIVVFFTIIPLFLNLYALKGINSSTVGIMMYTNPLINFFLAIFLYKEGISWIQIISYFLILISIVIFNEKIIFSRKKKGVELSTVNSK